MVASCRGLGALRLFLLDGSALLTNILGPWEQIFGAGRSGWPVSLDGRRRKRVLVKIIGEQCSSMGLAVAGQDSR